MMKQPQGINAENSWSTKQHSSNNIPLLSCVTESAHVGEDSDRTCHPGQHTFISTGQKTQGADLT